MKDLVEIGELSFLKKTQDAKSRRNESKKS